MSQQNVKDELDVCKEQIAQLQNQLDMSNQQNAQLQLKVWELNALLLAVPPNPSLSHATLAKCSAGIVSGNNRRNEHFLRGLFNRHKDASGGLSGQNLLQALRDAEALNIPTSDQEIIDIIKQFDVNGNGTLEFGEFLQFVNEPDELQVWFSEKQLPLAADALRPLIGRCSDQLKELSELSPALIDHGAAAMCSIIPGLLQELHQELHDSFAIQIGIEAEMKADPSKFNDFFKMA